VSHASLIAQVVFATLTDRKTKLTFILFKRNFTFL